MQIDLSRSLIQELYITSYNVQIYYGFEVDNLWICERFSISRITFMESVYGQGVRRFKLVLKWRICTDHSKCIVSQYRKIYFKLPAWASEDLQTKNQLLDRVQNIGTNHEWLISHWVGMKWVSNYMPSGQLLRHRSGCSSEVVFRALASFLSTYLWCRQFEGSNSLQDIEGAEYVIHALRRPTSLCLAIIALFGMPVAHYMNIAKR